MLRITMHFEFLQLIINIWTKVLTTWIDEINKQTLLLSYGICIASALRLFM